MGVEARALGDHILLICTPSLRDSPGARQVRSALGDALAAEFDDVLPHVPKEAVAAARSLAEQHQVNVVVAIGGGSAIGVGKAVVLATRSPLIAIPTTYSGSEMTSVVGITDRAEGKKRLQRDPAALPRLVVYDPDVTLELSSELTAATGMNALAHCVEACYSRDASPEVRRAALDGIRHIVRSLPLCVANGRDIEAREDLLHGARLAGLSIANSTMALHHGLCHVLGGRTGVAHGVLNAIVLPHVMRFNADAVPDAMSAIADAMDAGARTRDVQAAARFTAALLESLPVPKRLREVGVKAEALDSIAAEAAVNPTVRANPKPASEADIRALLASAW